MAGLKDTTKASDTLSVKITRGDGSEENFIPQVVKETSKDEIVRKKTGQDSLEQYMLKVWNIYINALGKKFLDPPRWLMRAVIEKQEEDPICLGCLFCEENKCILGIQIKPEITIDFLCESFAPNQDGLKHLMKWMLQGRIVSYSA